MFDENLWAEVAIQIMISQSSSLKDYQAIAQRAGSILKHAGIFEYAKKREQNRKKLSFNSVEKRFLTFQPAGALVTSRKAGSLASMVLGMLIL